MKQISALKVFVTFECLSCKETSNYCGVCEAIETGAPLCPNCEEIMEIVECELDILED